MSSVGPNATCQGPTNLLHCVDECGRWELIVLLSSLHREWGWEWESRAARAVVSQEANEPVDPMDVMGSDTDLAAPPDRGSHGPALLSRPQGRMAAWLALQDIPVGPSTCP